jgi:hypothetical protein
MTPSLSRSLLAAGLAAPLLLSGGCLYDEGLIISNMQGTVFIPEAAATREIVDANGVPQTVTDIKLIGPVYLGVYPSILPKDVIAPYPHPEVGPQYLESIAGDAYPYGGTTVGDLRFACLEFLTCKITSGRFVDWQTIIDWFASLGLPIKDASGVDVTTGTYLQQTCFDQLNVTSDAEARLTAYQDVNDDGGIDALDLDFVWDEADHGYRAPFTLWQQEFFWDLHEEEETGCTPGKDCTGFSLWGWMDAPSDLEYSFSTCDGTFGFPNEIYNNEFQGGSVQPDVLNFPSTYISTGDAVASQGIVWDDIYDQPELVLDLIVE